MYFSIAVLVICFPIGCQNSYDNPMKPGEKERLQSLLRKALNAKKNNDTILEESCLKRLRNLSENKSRLNYWAANYHLGRLEYARHNYRRAITYYNIAHNVDPTLIEVYHRANSYYSLGKLDSARQDFNSTIKFVKEDFVRRFPNTSLSKCDTCGFPFGSQSYNILTDGWIEN